MVEGAVIVYAKDTRDVPSLKMASDGQEIPSPSGDEQLAGTWLGGECIYLGQAMDAGSAEAGPATARDATAALTIAGGRLLAIVSPNHGDESIWVSWPLSTIIAYGTGEQGLLKKRPRAIGIDHRQGAENGGDTIVVKHVMRFWPNSRQAEPRQEASLLEALLGNA